MSWYFYHVENNISVHQVERKAGQGYGVWE